MESKIECFQINVLKLFLAILYLTPHKHSFNRLCHYCIPVLETSLRMAVLRPKQIQAYRKWQMTVCCWLCKCCIICCSSAFIIQADISCLVMSILMFTNSRTAVSTPYLGLYLLCSHTHCVTDIDYSTASENTRNARKVFLITGSNKTQETVIECTTYECWQKPHMKMEAEYFWTYRIWITWTNTMYWPQKQIIIKSSLTHKHILCSLLLSELHVVAENSNRCS